MSEQRLITLLGVEQAPAATAAIARALGGAGYTVQEIVATREEDVLHDLEYKPVDLIVLGNGGELPSVGTLCELVAKAAKTVPVLVAFDDPARVNPLDALRAGAANVVDTRDPEWAVLVIEQALRQARIQEQAQTQEIRLRETEKRCELVLECAKSAIAYIHEGVHSYANPAYVKLFDYTQQDELQSIAFLDLIKRDDHDRVKRLLRQSMRMGLLGEPIDITAIAKNGRAFPARLSCAATRMDEEPCQQILIESNAEQVNYERKLEEISKRDIFTGLFNRYFFTEYVDGLRASRAGGAVLYVLLGAYRSISEDLGLEAVDSMVKELSKVLVRVISEREVIARFSDAVFAIYTPRTTQRDLVDLGNRIKDTIKNYTSHAMGKLISTTASVGIRPLMDDDESTTQIFLHADRACETAREMGGDQARLYNPAGKDADAKEQQGQVLEQLRDAISNERLQTFYQPIASFEGDASERYKVYLRILDAEQKPLPMSAVTPIAEQQGLLGPLDKWVFGRCLEVLAERLQGESEAPILFVGISTNSLMDENFSSWLEKRLNDADIRGNQFVLEVREEIAEQHFIQARRLRQQLENLGCGFALSYFGGRANSERLLEHLNPDYIKLDGSLIEQLAKVKDEHTRQAIEQLTVKAHNINTLVIASRIATAPQMASIWQFGVTLVQGDMVQEPGPQMEFDFRQFAG